MTRQLPSGTHLYLQGTLFWSNWIENKTKMSNWRFFSQNIKFDRNSPKTRLNQLPWSLTCNDDSLSWTLRSHSSNCTLPTCSRASRYPLMALDPLGVQESLDCTLVQLCRDQEVVTDCSLHPNRMSKCYPGSSSPHTFHCSKNWTCDPWMKGLTRLTLNNLKSDIWDMKIACFECNLYVRKQSMIN